ncbi:F0F1 ATP synthase subunit delta [Alkalicoccus daliensis]|uniref:ATP synthase subunit delta n=1 Tax=Alkalicoccus daliensis TaxID=745820 RepID=A0A1H0GL51_9BACI|nr:F0F1 ATP synthase subunit delta [Alkalicoccus daliensis]SDO07667.1 ATP synthase F1 subcomplex delta subunit [Alkalicoccus daliensis]
MIKHPLGSRYAAALFELAQERNALDQTLTDLDTVTQVIQETNLLDEVFRHPKMTGSRKKEILKQAFQGKVSEHVLNLLQLLVDNKRESLFTAIAEDFKTLTYEAQGTAEATVYSAKLLGEAEKTAIGEVFARKAGKAKLLIENVVDKDVIGGLRVRIGDTVYDGTVANQLARIHERMIAGNSR